MLTLSKVVRAAFSSASKLLELQLREDGAEGDDEGARPEDQASFLSQLGVAVRPVVASTLRALTFDDGDDTIVVKLVDKARSPTDLDEGETRVFSAGTIANAVRLLGARIIVEAPEIRLGATATKKVARVGDTVRVTIPEGTTLTGTVGGSPATFTVGVGGVVADGTITSGSNKVRAED